MIGVKNLDFSKITAKKGFLLDNDTLDTIVIGGPSYFAIDVAAESQFAIKVMAAFIPFMNAIGAVKRGYQRVLV